MTIIRHMRRYFLPSRTLGRYITKMLMTRFLGILVGLVAVLQMLDLLAQSDTIMAADGASAASIAKYIALRVPGLISQFAPFVALLATLLTLATLNQSSEVIIMKAIGLSAHRILLPLGLASSLIASGHFLFNELVVVRAAAELDYWASQDYAIDLPPPPETAGRVWMSEGDQIILVEAVARDGSRFIMDKVALFERQDDGRLKSLMRAEFAWYQHGKWTLHEVRRFDVDGHTMDSMPVMDWDITTPPERFMALTVKPKHVSVLALYQSIRQLDREGLPTDRLLASFYQKFAAPAAALLMPLLAAVAAFGVHRAGSLLMRLITGMALGFTFFVADNFMLAMGEFGVAPPLLAAWAPFFVFLTLGYAVLFNTEEGRKKPVAVKTDPDPAAKGDTLS